MSAGPYANVSDTCGILDDLREMGDHLDLYMPPSGNGQSAGRQGMDLDVYGSIAEVKESCA